MGTNSAVAEHYGRDRPIDRIRDQLTSAGLDLDELEPSDLSGVDEFHLGGKLATIELLASAGLSESSHVLDVGCGIGGAARTVATLAGCKVTGVDLTPVFIDTARELSAMVGVAERVEFAVGDATALEFPDATFDAITMVHVGMNIAAKSTLFAELARVLRPGGTLHVYDIMRTGDGDLTFPLPWATDASTSFVASADEYVAAIRAVGLVPSAPLDRISLVTRALEASAETPPVVNLAHLMGPEWPAMFSNLRAMLAQGVLTPIEIVAARSVER